jgi:hypothetical protein
MEEAQAVYTAYKKLSPQSRRMFDALLAAHADGLKTRTQSEAGRKAAATKKAKPAGAGAEA